MAEFIRDKAGATEAQQKKALAFLFAQDSVGLATDGVLSGLQVTQTGTASANVLVGAGAAVTQDTVGNGASLMVNDTQKTLDVLTANPMGATARNDLVVFDSATASIRVVVGTPNVSPTDPTVPATATALARLRHAASATTVPTAKIDDLRTFTGLASGADTGWVTAASVGFTAATNFSGLSGNVRRIGSIVQLSLSLTTTNAIAAGDVSNTTIINVPSGWQVTGANLGGVQGGSSGGGWTGYQQNAAVVMASTVNGFSAGATFSVLATYML